VARCTAILFTHTHTTSHTHTHTHTLTLYSVQVSEYATWSAAYYSEIIKTILSHLGHSPDLVQIVTGAICKKSAQREKGGLEAQLSRPRIR
jgi:hypothetical protein